MEKNPHDKRSGTRNSQLKTRKTGQRDEGKGQEGIGKPSAKITTCGS